MTLEELARVAGISTNTVYRLEAGKADNVRKDTVIRVARALNMAGQLTDAEWAELRALFDLSDAVGLRPSGAGAINHAQAATSPAVQMASFLRTIDATRAAAMQLVFELMDRAGPEKVVEALEALKKMMNATTQAAAATTVQPGTVVHRREIVREGVRVTEFSPHLVNHSVTHAQAATLDQVDTAKPRARKIER